MRWRSGPLRSRNCRKSWHPGQMPPRRRRQRCYPAPLQSNGFLTNWHPGPQRSIRDRMRWPFCPVAVEKLPEALAPWPNADEKPPVALDNCPTAVELPPVAVALLGQTKFPAPSWEHVLVVGNGPASAAPDPNMPGAGMAEIAIVAPSAVPVRRPIRVRLERETVPRGLRSPCRFSIVFPPGWPAKTPTTPICGSPCAPTATFD